MFFEFPIKYIKNLIRVEILAYLSHSFLGVRIFFHSVTHGKISLHREPSAIIISNEQEMVNEIKYQSPLGNIDHILITFEFVCQSKPSKST